MTCRVSSGAALLRPAQKFYLVSPLKEFCAVFLSGLWSDPVTRSSGMFGTVRASAGRHFPGAKSSCKGTPSADGVTLDVNGTRWLLSWGISMHRHPLPSLSPCLEAGDTSLQAHVPPATTLGPAQAPQGHPAAEYSQIHIPSLFLPTSRSASNKSVPRAQLLPL